MHSLPPVLLAIAASMAASGAKTLSPDLLVPLHLDPTSAYHLAQIVGTVLLFLAVTRPARLSSRRELRPEPVPS